MIPNKEITSVKIKKDLSSRISIISMLEQKKKELFLEEILVGALKPYESKYKRIKL